jgi:hypothetical protein
MVNEAIECSASSDAWGKAAIIVGHPGHELMVYNWIEKFQPMYFCLTEGSGGSSTSRLQSSTNILDSLGVMRGTVFGRFSDKAIYRFITEGNTEVFIELVCELADALIESEIDSVIGDAIEGFNPVHDVCRFIIDGAVERVRNQTGRSIRNYDFVLDSPPDTCPESLRDKAKWLHLDEAALDRKLNAALSYPELRDEVTRALTRFGRQAFSRECLRPSASQFMIERFETSLPDYERYGEIRVDEGRYTEAIRYRFHVWPVIDAIEKLNRL